MKLVAALICKDEMPRYLRACVASLQTFCDEIRVVDDASTDGSFDWLAEQDRVEVIQYPSSRFFTHEGRARQGLLEWTLKARPTHVINLDMDEFVTDGPALRALIEEQPTMKAWHIPIAEVWAATEERILERVDGGWRTGRTLCWRRPAGGLAFPNRKLACGRVPSQVRTLAAKPAALSLLHCGWLDEADRVARASRYAKHDGGRFHASAHLQSILWPAEKIELRARAWPEALAPWKDAILEHAGVKA